MESWVVVGAAFLVALVAVVVALLVPGRRSRAPALSWTVPRPEAIRAARLPVAWPGYDPAHVDALLEAVAEAYEELYAAAGPQVIARARARVVDRRGAASRPSRPDRP